MVQSLKIDLEIRRFISVHFMSLASFRNCEGTGEASGESIQYGVQFSSQKMFYFRRPPVFGG